MARQDPPLTAAEKARIAFLVARMTKRCAINEDIDRTDLERQMDRILDAARKRQEAAQQR